MVSLTERKRSTLIKALVLGDSGGGKTSSLASLAKAGYKLFILDFDNGADILLDETVLPHEYWDNLDVEVCTDEFTGGTAGPRLKSAKALARAMSLLNKWNDKGSVNSWGDDTVLVIDSLTMMGDAALNYVLYSNARIGDKIRIQDWGEAMNIQESLLKQLYSSEVKCHVLINCHVKFISEESEDAISANVKGYPMALGRQLPPKVARYFNSVFFCQSIGSGSSERRVIKTQSTPQVELKNPRPSVIAPQYPISTGMAEIFEAIRGATPTTKQSA